MPALLFILVCLVNALGLPLMGAEAASPDVTFFCNLDQSNQRYLLKLPTGGVPQPALLLIALHGHGSDRHQFMTPGRDETRAALEMAERHHCIYVTPDYRAATSWMGPTAEADLVQ